MLKSQHEQTGDEKTISSFSKEHYGSPVCVSGVYAYCVSKMNLILTSRKAIDITQYWTMYYIQLVNSTRLQFVILY